MENTAQQNITLECHECGLGLIALELQINEKALCPRCRHTLTIKRENVLEKITALSITSLIFLLLSFPFEFLSISTNGLDNQFDLVSSFKMLIANQHHWLAIIEFVTVFLIPFLISILFLFVFQLRSTSVKATNNAWSINLIHKLLPWSMVEVFFIAVLISMIKIFSLATVSIGPSFIAFILFSISTTLICLHIDEYELSKLTNLQEAKLELKGNSEASRSQSIQKTWALLLTSILLYIPANTLPIMYTTTLGQENGSTIIGGVILLWEMKSYPIAIVIFIASVVVPTAKILAIAWLNYTVQSNISDARLQRTKLYRIAEFVGRWSMVDVFVVVILVSLIQMGNVMSINPGGAALAFFGVVVSTMLAAMAFNPQLIWNKSNNES